MRTYIVLPVMCEKRVGFNHVSKLCRLIFFSSAPRMRTHWFNTAVDTGTNDIRRVFFLKIHLCSLYAWIGPVVQQRKAKGIPALHESNTLEGSRRLDAYESPRN